VLTSPEFDIIITDLLWGLNRRWCTAGEWIMPDAAVEEEAQDTQHGGTANHAWQQPNDRSRNQEKRRGWDVRLQGKGASWVGLLPISSKASGRRKHWIGWNWHTEKKVRYVTNFGYVPLLFSCVCQRLWIYLAWKKFFMSEVWQPCIICRLNFIHILSSIPLLLHNLTGEGVFISSMEGGNRFWRPLS
jgi:hypothetical protein